MIIHNIFSSAIFSVDPSMHHGLDSLLEIQIIKLDLSHGYCRVRLIIGCLDALLV